MKFPRMHLLAAGILALSPVLALAQDAPDKNDYGAAEAEADEAKTKLVDEVPGYGGVALGAEFPVKGFELEQDRGKLKIYKKEGEPLLLGPALLETVLYYVFDGKFYGVAFHTNDGQDTLSLKSVLIYAFGQGQSSADGGPTTIWLGKKNGALFELNQTTGDGSVFIFNHELHDACLADQSKSAQAAAQQLIKGK